MAVILWTPQKLTKFKLVYADSLGKGMSQFTFEDNTIVTAYGPTLINAVDKVLKKS